ncbi:hypothetical protein AB832_08390 [Flavobacteriaceae bacterium (ex Bugula neritina AB1)]|jgi:hypothetical protein|nr:hypothetical protein AB832_08390 [Flavobacteriaceae bacterium (ex Bugula neritina AB1)]
MIIATINFSGNVGKSTVANHLLMPRLENAVLIPVESINEHEGDKDEVLRGREFQELMERAMIEENAVIDVGASNVEEFMAQMSDYTSSHNDFDYFVIPTVATRKQIDDTWATIEELSDIGVPRDKIKIVFNKMDRYSTVSDAFGKLLSLNNSDNLCSINESISIADNELYPKLKDQNRSISELAACDTDYRELINEEQSKEGKVKLVRELGLVRLAKGVESQLDTVFFEMSL